MEELLIPIGTALAGIVVTYVNHRWKVLRRVVNRLRGHRPARPMRYSGGLERYMEWKASKEKRDGP